MEISRKKFWSTCWYATLIRGFWGYLLCNLILLNYHIACSLRIRIASNGLGLGYFLYSSFTRVSMVKTLVHRIFIRANFQNRSFSWERKFVLDFSDLKYPGKDVFGSKIVHSVYYTLSSVSDVLTSSVTSPMTHRTTRVQFVRAEDACCDRTRHRKSRHLRTPWQGFSYRCWIPRWRRQALRQYILLRWPPYFSFPFI